MPEQDRVPRLARPFVALLVVAMFASAVFAWEPWPLTSFRLFSEARVDNQSTWRATTVDATGAEEDYPLGGLPRGFRGFVFTMSEFADAGVEHRDELCRTWVEAAPELVGREATEVRIYQRRWLLSDRTGDRARRGTEELAFTCTAEGVEDAS